MDTRLKSEADAVSTDTGDLSAIGSREALLDVIGCLATPEACCGAARETAASDRASLTLETISGRVSTESTRLGRDVFDQLPVSAGVTAQDYRSGPLKSLTLL